MGGCYSIPQGLLSGKNDRPPRPGLRQYGEGDCIPFAEDTENTEPFRNIYGFLTKTSVFSVLSVVEILPSPPSNPSTRLIHAPFPAKNLDPPTVSAFSPVRLPCRISPGQGMRMTPVVLNFAAPVLDTA